MRTVTSPANQSVRAVCGTALAQVNIFQPLGSALTTHLRTLPATNRSASADRPVLGRLTTRPAPGRRTTPLRSADRAAPAGGEQQQQEQSYEFSSGTHQSVVVKDVLTLGARSQSGYVKATGRTIGESPSPTPPSSGSRASRLRPARSRASTGTVQEVAQRSPHFTRRSGALGRLRSTSTPLSVVGASPGRKRGRTQAIYVADSLDNGAGYAVEREAREPAGCTGGDQRRSSCSMAVDGSRRLRQRVPRLPALVGQPLRAPVAGLAARTRCR